MGTIALPRMLERGYDKRLAVGAINCGGGWGILIPPSIPMVLYALLTELSVGRLFASGIGPGILLFILVSIYIGVRSWLQPTLAPALPVEERGDRLKITSLKAVPSAVHRLSGARAIFEGLRRRPKRPRSACSVRWFVGSASQPSFTVLSDAAMQTLRLTALIM